MCEIRDVLFGVYLNKVRGVTLRRLDIEGPRGLPESRTGNGIHLYYLARHAASTTAGSPGCGTACISSTPTAPRYAAIA